MTAARLKTVEFLAIPVLAAAKFPVDLITPWRMGNPMEHATPPLFTLQADGRWAVRPRRAT